MKSRSRAKSKEKNLVRIREPRQPAPREPEPISEVFQEQVEHLLRAVVCQILDDCMSKDEEGRKEVKRWMDSPDFLDFCVLMDYHPDRFYRQLCRLLDREIVLKGWNMRIFVKPDRHKSPSTSSGKSITIEEVACQA